MQFLRRLTLVDAALFVALIVAGVLAIGSQRVPLDPVAGGAPAVVTGVNETTAQAYDAAIERLYIALADGATDVTGEVETIAAVARTAGDAAFADAAAELARAYAAGDAAARDAAVVRLEAMEGDSPFAPSFIEAFVGGTFSFALNGGPSQPATGMEWAHLVWVDAANEVPFGWEVVAGEAIWTVEPGSAAVLLAFTLPGVGYSGTLRLAPAGPGALIDVSGSFSAPLQNTIIALGDPIPVNAGILIRDDGVGAGARPGQPWAGETRLGEPPGLLRSLAAAESIAWSSTLPDGRAFIMRMLVGATGRAAIDQVFPG